jgi:hypothetical protein
MGMLQRRFFLFCVVLFCVLGGPLRSFAQVTLQTGSAVFSLPMFNWQDAKSRLNSVISLSYTSGNGLKVTDVASNEGQGWTLIAGGVVSRIQVGEPDDQPGFIGYSPVTETVNGQPVLVENSQDLTKYPAGILYDTIPLQRGCPDALTQYPTYGGKNVLYGQHVIVGQDRQMDRFTFSFNGKSGEFVIDTVGGWHGVLLGDSKMKISLQVDPTMIQYGIRTTITSFTITDVDGLIYKFTKHGLTKLLSMSFSNADGSKPAAQPKISNDGVYCQSSFDQGPTAAPWHNANISNPFIISNWYLSEVDDPFTTRKILFSYDSLTLNNSAGADISYNKGTDNYALITYKKSITTTQEIASIMYPDTNIVTFNYASTSRFDYPGQKALSNVTITYRYQGVTRTVSQYQLNTTYFILGRYGTPSIASENSICRLCLRSIKKISVDLKEDLPPYQFDYYKSTGSGSADDYVPPPFCYAKDIWGYYNGNNSIAYSSPLSGATKPVPLTAANPYALNSFDDLLGLCFQNQYVTGTYYNAKANYAENGLLKEVIYPTGGSLTYTYAQNSGSFVGSPTVYTIGGVHVSQTSSSDGGYSNGCGTPIITQYNYVLNGVGSASSMWGAETPTNWVTSNNFWQEQKSVFTFSITSGFHCKWYYIYPGIQSQYDAVSLDQFQRLMNTLGPILGALSIIGQIDDVINVLGPATGPGEIIAIALDIITDVLEIAISCTHQSKNNFNTIYYNFDLNGVAPLPAQFKRVEITESPGTIGKTVETFTDGDPGDAGGPDYPLWFAAGTNTSLSMKQRFAPWAYGLPKVISVYDVNGNLIKRTQNVYDYSNAQEELINYGPCYGAAGQALSYKCQVINNYSERSDVWASLVQYDAPSFYTAAASLTTPATDNGNMIADLYDTYTGRVNLDTTYERIYRTTDSTQYVQTATAYTYNQGWLPCEKQWTGPFSTNYDVNQITTFQSNGDINYKSISYPWNYNNGLAGNNEGIYLQALLQANIISTPVETQTWVTKANSGGTLWLGERVTEFAQVANGDIRPSRILEQRFAVPPTSLTPYSGPANGVTNYSNYKIPEILTYDVNSNLVGAQDEGNRLVTNVYSYNDKYIVATVINANPLVDKPAYTSFEDTAYSRSGWVLSGVNSINVGAPSETGYNNFTLQASGANSLSASGLNTATAYILSFWASNSNVAVTGGATLTRSAPTYNGFTYYEYSIAAGTSSVVVKSGSATVNIDELRLYPAGARMHTTTYDPLIGKTSECDENNRITYYTYDNLARMQFVEDETHNIMKMYEYNNVSQTKQTGCPATYSSPAISELVVRNNCTAGYQGGTVTYTMPAGQFTSTTSQQDADFQAELYFLTYAQPYANTNGVCSLIYYNAAQSQTDTSQNCAPGYVGGLVTYTVPAQTYSSIVSQTNADSLALADIAANAQMYADLPANQVCSLNTAADWEWYPGDSVTPSGQSYCASVNGNLPPHLFVLLTDVNPNSPTYNQTMWEDYGPDAACPAGNYYNVVESQAFTSNNCGSGYSGSTVTYTVPAGKYSSTTSQAAANQLATNDINANGQNYANANGTCVLDENISYNNSRAFQYSVRFTNNSTGAVYNFTPNASSSGTLGQVPAGTYTVYICPVNNYTANNNYTVFGATQESVVCATFNNVTVTGAGTLYFF